MLFFSIGESIVGVIRSIFMWIFYQLFKLVGGIFNVLIYLSQVSVFDKGIIEQIFTRFQVILYIGMVFYISFEVVRYTVNPERASDKEKGTSGLIKRAVITVLLMAFMNTIFGYADRIKGIFVNTSILPDIIFTDENDKTEVKNRGREFAGLMMGLFYRVDNDFLSNETFGKHCDDHENETPQQLIEKNLVLFKEDRSTVSNFTDCLGAKIDGERVIDMNWLIALPVGLFAIYAIGIYCIEAGKVVFQLAFLQAISPIPIICYLAPSKDGTFQKWMKMTLMAYFDIIIRMFLLYMVMFFMDILFKAFDTGLFSNFNSSLGIFTKLLIMIFLVVGLLYFLVEAPKMIKDLLPKSLTESMGGSFGFGKEAGGKRAMALRRSVGGAAGAIAGGWSRARERTKANKKARMTRGVDDTGNIFRRLRNRAKSRADYNRRTKADRDAAIEKANKAREGAETAYKKAVDKINKNPNLKGVNRMNALNAARSKYEERMAAATASELDTQKSYRAARAAGRSRFFGTDIVKGAVAGAKESWDSASALKDKGFIEGLRPKNIIDTYGNIYDNGRATVQHDTQGFSTNIFGTGPSMAGSVQDTFMHMTERELQRSKEAIEAEKKRVEAVTKAESSTNDSFSSMKKKVVDVTTSMKNNATIDDLMNGGTKFGAFDVTDFVDSSGVTKSKITYDDAWGKHHTFEFSKGMTASQLYSLAKSQAESAKSELDAAMSDPTKTPDQIQAARDKQQASDSFINDLLNRGIRDASMKKIMSGSLSDDEKRSMFDDAYVSENKYYDAIASALSNPEIMNNLNLPFTDPSDPNYYLAEFALEVTTKSRGDWDRTKVTYAAAKALDDMIKSAASSNSTLQSEADSALGDISSVSEYVSAEKKGAVSSSDSGGKKS